MKDFQTGDFIRLKDISKWQTGRVLHKAINIFEISKISDEFITIKGSKDQIPLEEIEPIPIDGVHDKDIYYDGIFASPVVHTDDPIPIGQVNRNYYFDAFRDYPDGSSNIQQLIKDQGCHYVHEVQHYLTERGDNITLKTDSI